MNKRNWKFVLSINMIFLMFCYFSLINLLQPVQANVASQTISTPIPFLGPIYYGRWDVLNIFDHDLPLAGVANDNNDDVLHHNGIYYLGVTVTAIAGATPTPTGWATPAPYIAEPGYGYDQHGGIDYDLNYVPVLAAADGEVTVAGWNNPANHRSGYGLYVTINHGDYRTIYGHLSALTVQG